jgi:outer membrane protein assembly factor BamB
MRRFISLFLTFILIAGLSLSVNAFSEIGNNAPDGTGIHPWLMYSHDAYGTNYSPKNLGDEFEEAMDWPFDSDAGSAQSLGTGSVAYDGILYSVLYDGSRGGQSAELIAIEMESGEEIWRAETENRLSISCPAIDPVLGHIYVASTDGFGPKGSGSTVITAFTLEDGEEEWVGEATGAISSPITTSEGFLYFKTMFALMGEDDDDFMYKTDSSLLIKMDAESGDVDWEVDIEGGEYLGWASPVSVHEDYLYTCSAGFAVSSEGRQSISPPGYIYCIDADTGNIIWDYIDNAGLGVSSCNDDEQVYFIRGRIEGNSASLVVSAHDLDSGEEIWEFYQTNTLCFGTAPAMNEDYLFVQDAQGKLWALDKDDGKDNWSKSVGGTSQFENMALAGDYIVCFSPEISNNSFTGGTEVIILDASRRGKRVWKEDIDEEIIGHVLVYGNKIFFTGKQEIFCFQSLAPKLEIKPDRILLDKVERNTITDIELSLENVGIKGLEGSVEVDQEWLSIDIDSVDDNTSEAILTINTWNMDQGDYSGRVIFDTNGGKVLLAVLITVVDEEPPVIEWDLSDFIEIDGSLYTKEVEITLKGQTEPTAFVYINDEEAELDADGFFEFFIELEEGENEILVEAEDDVGNKGEETFIIYLDTKPPSLNITTPDYAISTEDRFYIIGQCDEEDAVVTVDDMEIELGKGGKFAYEVSLEKGVNAFVIKAVDKIGNENVVELHIVYPDKKIVILRIGNNQAEVNGQIVQLDAPPTIINGRTMVPLRFVSETFGAEVGWDGNEQKITLIYYGKTIQLWIGRSTAMVNDEPMILDAPPTIINGRTMVPLRFCAETFGAEVGWDGATQTITLIYPKS